jgi:hypothetical protein
MTAISGTDLQDIATSAQIHPTTCHIVAPRRYARYSPYRPMHREDSEHAAGILFRPENFCENVSCTLKMY